jgi:hypothetical protein
MKLGTHSDSVLLWKLQRALSLRDADTKRNFDGRKHFQRENLHSALVADQFSEGKSADEAHAHRRPHPTRHTKY